jgi:hypothetical protein
MSAAKSRPQVGKVELSAPKLRAVERSARKIADSNDAP